LKAASSGTLAILAAGQYVKFEFYKFVLPNLGTFFFHNADTGPLVIATPSSVAGTYLPGLTIVRSAFTQKTGLDVQSVDLTIEPQADNPGGAVTLAGGAFLSQIRAGGFDGGLITISKGFFNHPAAGAALDVSPGVVPWFQGVVDEVQAGRFSVDVTVNDTSQLLNIQMPRNILQAGCVHEVFDAGCTLLASTFTVAGSVSGGIGANGFNTNLTAATGYWQRGIIKFTSGVLNGSSYVVSAYSNTSGAITTIVPLAAAPAVSDTFSIRPNCLKSQAACSNTNVALGPAFNNLTHYRGAPYVPQPETLYDGGTSATTAPALGGQGGQGAGSSFSGVRGPATYVP
jgi:Uncharacterized conserved protein (DUF2163)/Phage conserved hypothetical protein BR0599